MLYKRKPDYSTLKVFGSLVYYTNNPQKDKFDSRAGKGVFIGYSSGQKEYKIYSLDSKKIEICQDVVFHESIFPFKSESTAFDEAPGDIPLPKMNGTNVEVTNYTPPIPKSRMSHSLSSPVIVSTSVVILLQLQTIVS